MTPGARLQATIEALDAIAATPRPADAVVSAWFRGRRYIGAKDRHAIADSVYRVLRHYGRLGWWLDHCHHDRRDGRALVFAEQALGGQAAGLARLCDGGRFGPPAPDEGEARLIRRLDTHTLEHPHMPDPVRLECPDWAEAPLRAWAGDGFATELAALIEPAPTDLRVNPIKGDRDQARAALATDGITATPTRWSPWGLRLDRRAAITATGAFRDGLIEIQDEGSQLVALVTDARPGHQVVDFCAGAGGKTLALAATMANRGRVVATDVLARRLERATLRLRRAGLHNVETKALSGERDPWVKRHKGGFDRVLVDAPCSGTGTWRRNPDSRWRLLGPGLAELVPLQAAILDSAARLVRPGGRLVYATCSLLPEENERQIEAFLAGHPEFAPLPLDLLWPGLPGVSEPPPCAGPWLRLSPARHGTDGFFAAVLSRAEAA